LVHIFLDFEMNAIPKKRKEAREIFRAEICEIGAVRLNDQYEVVDRYSQYVKPVLCEITPMTTQITGITGEDVEDALPLPEALEEFERWIGEEPCRVYAWGDSDKAQLYGECFAKGLFAPDSVPKQFRRWMDFQRVYSHLVGLSRNRPLSLKNAIGSIEEDFTGTQHRAVDDAENSAALLRLVHNREQFEQRNASIRNMMGVGKKRGGVTLGDLFGAQLAEFSEE
jgi:inhibitor of KinA sporulation pathway (predicted exonuclease)